MAIKIRYSNEAENKAIIEKVEKILNSTDHPTHKNIVISASPDCYTEIRYNITEMIIPDNDLACEVDPNERK